MSRAGPTSGTTRRVRRTALLALVLVLPSVGPRFSPAALHAQQPDLDKSRQRLEEIRAERDRLRREQERLQGQVRDTGRELENLERQRETTNRIVNELERQIGGLGSQLDEASVQLLLAQDNLVERRAVLQRRLVEIYKRGPLHTFKVLLSADSFADLLSRYKYLFLTSRQDRTIVQDIERLRNRILAQRGELFQVQDQLARRREEREAELNSFRLLARERSSKVRELRQSSQSASRRLSALARDEEQLIEVLAALERNRRPAADAPAGPRTSRGGLSTADLGRLDWPVEGQILHTFGPDTLPSGGRITRHGISIAASAGTPVTAVSAGKVVLVQRLGTYGLSVILEHPTGYYSLYMQLSTAGVSVGQAVAQGATVGTVGGSNTPDGSHLYFEIRGDNQIALDPTDWLRRRRR